MSKWELINWEPLTLNVVNHIFGRLVHTFYIGRFVHIESKGNISPTLTFHCGYAKNTSFFSDTTEISILMG
jgi:hypothetical protein